MSEEEFKKLEEEYNSPKNVKIRRQAEKVQIPVIVFTLLTMVCLWIILFGVFK